MSSGRTHRAIGTAAGAGYALAKANQQAPEHVLLEILRGALAGNFGARLPDVFDSPLHPGHRSLAHGIVPVATAGRAAVNALDGWQVQLRAEANRTLERLWQALVEVLCRLGAGALAGLLAGYGSHVALDAFTPVSLPLLA